MEFWGWVGRVKFRRVFLFQRFVIYRCCVWFCYELSFGINATLILINDCFPNNGTSVTVKVTDIDMVNRSGDIFLGFFIIVIISICLIPYCARRCGYGCGGWCKFRCKCKCNSILKSIKTSCCENCLTRRALQWKEDWKMRRSQQLASNVQSNMQYGDNFYNELWAENWIDYKVCPGNKKNHVILDLVKFLVELQCLIWMVV